MKIEQHVYTSGKKGFATVAVAPGISRQEQFALEKHSLYILPGSMLYKENITTPIKYVFYPLNEKRLVVGKAVYAGKDNMDRSGNYFFHNFIMEKEDILKVASNPIELIKFIEKKKLFLNKIPDMPLLAVEIVIDEVKVKRHEGRKPRIPDNFIVSLLQFCLNPDLSRAPLLLIGTDRECLDFLEWLYALLPDDIIGKISFDTYSYGTGLDFRIAGMPRDAEFQQSLSYALKIDLATGECISILKAEEPSGLISFVAREAVAGEVEEIKTIYFLEKCLQKGDYDNFKVKHKTASNQIKDFLFMSHKKAILDRIVTHKDMDLLSLVIKKIDEEDVSAFFSAPDIIFKTKNLWKLFINMIKRQPEDIDFLMEEKSAKELADCYSPQLEETLLDTVLSALPEVYDSKKLIRDFVQVINNLPAPKAEGAGLVRAYIGYRLTDEPALLKKLIGGDISTLPEKYRGLVLDSVLEGIIETCDLKDMPNELSTVFDKYADKEKYLLRLLNFLEGLKMSNKAKTALKDILLAMYAKLPQDEAAQNIKARIEKIFEPKPSLFKRILGREDKKEIEG